jgi:hypothetical protein
MGLIITPLCLLLLWYEADSLIEKFQSQKRMAREAVHLTFNPDSLNGHNGDGPKYTVYDLIEKKRDEESRPPVYPYSVVDGGVHSIPELRTAILRDPVVAAHYVHFDLDRARVVEMKATTYFHVSYRIEGEVFWTKKKLKVSRGEKLITDGLHFTRTRCGNLLSAFPRGITSPDEPPPEVFDAPQYPPWHPPSEPQPVMFVVPAALEQKRASVSEPATLMFLAPGLIGLAGYGGKKFLTNKPKITMERNDAPLDRAARASDSS